MSKNEDQTIKQALKILKSRIRKVGYSVARPADAQNYLILKLAELEHEVFAVMFLDTRHCLIEYNEMFRGTIAGTSVHPREVAKRALHVNASAAIFAHNHPSTVAEPSQADLRVTKNLSTALALFDVRVLDHLIVGGTTTFSFAEHGYL